MSSTSIKALWPGEKVEELRELRNSYGGAPVVWDALSQSYLGSEPFGYMEHLKRLWPLWRDKSVARHLRAVLMMTYDNAYVSKEHYNQAAQDIKAFLTEFPPELDHACHWPVIASIFESNPDCPAIGFHWTSVSEDPFEGSWNEKLNQPNPVDWSRTWCMYSKLDITDAA